MSTAVRTERKSRTATSDHTPNRFRQPLETLKGKCTTLPKVPWKSSEPFIKNYKTIWDPAAGASEKYPLKDCLEKLGHRVVTTDIIMGNDYDFFNHKTKKRYELLVTTPPYSLRKEFILRATELKKPFAFLVPVNVLESKTIRDLLKQYNMTIVFPGKTANFTSPTDSKSVKALPYSIWVIGGISDLPPIVYL